MATGVQVANTIAVPAANPRNVCARGIARPAYCAFQPVAQVVFEHLAIALREIAAIVVAIGSVEAGRTVGEAVQAIGRGVDIVVGIARAGAGADRAGDQVVQRIVAVGGSAPTCSAPLSF